MSRLLVIDDDPMVTRVIHDHFSNEGYEVSAASHPEEGFDEAIHNTPDIILLDINMPGATGFQMCARFRAHPVTRSIPIILMTGTARFPNQQAIGRQMGANDYILKPFNIFDVGERVRTILGKEKSAKVETAPTPAVETPKPAEPTPEPPKPVAPVTPVSEKLEPPTPPMPVSAPSVPPTLEPPMAPVKASPILGTDAELLFKALEMAESPTPVVPPVAPVIPASTISSMPSQPVVSELPVDPAPAPVPEPPPAAKPSDPVDLLSELVIMRSKIAPPEPLQEQTPMAPPTPVMAVDPPPTPAVVVAPIVTPRAPVLESPVAEVPTMAPSEPVAAPPLPSELPQAPAVSPAAQDPFETETDSSMRWTFPMDGQDDDDEATETLPTAKSFIFEELPEKSDELLVEPRNTPIVPRRSAAPAVPVRTMGESNVRLATIVFVVHSIISEVAALIAHPGSPALLKEASFVAGGWALFLGLVSAATALFHISLSTEQALTTVGWAALPIVARSALILAANLVPSLSKIRDFVAVTRMDVPLLWVRPLDLFEMIAVCIVGLRISRYPGASIQKAILISLVVTAAWLLTAHGYFRP